jgi:hypothetical protein
VPLRHSLSENNLVPTDFGTKYLKFGAKCFCTKFLHQI